MVYDGDCRFCALWIKRWQHTTAERVDYLPFQDPIIAERFPEIPRAEFETAVHLIESDGRVFIGAQATLRARATNSSQRWLLRCYERSPFFAGVAERSYRFVAEHRTLFSKLTRIAYGNHVETPSYFLTRWLFLRALGIIYLIAFASLWTQIDGLIGSNGILPADQFMSQAKEQMKSAGIGPDRFRILPTLCWLNSSDWFLQFQCAAGVGLSLLLIAGIAPAPCLFLLWVVYLSLSAIGREFMSFQWDILLLETGFLAIFFAPRQLLPRPSREAPPSRLVILLFRWLLFRLMFESGCVKLLSGDGLWKNFTALSVHYQTQPLPTWIGWYAHQFPMWVQKISCLGMFFIELVVPFLFFAPRRIRFWAGVITASLQALILLTGNYTFFNWLTLALCLLLLDDFSFARFLPEKFRALFTNHESRVINPHWILFRRIATVSLAVVILALTSLQLVTMFGVRSTLLNPLASAHNWLSSFRSVNRYGLFAVMTPLRPEIIVEGSNDGINWLPYEFKHKPGDLMKKPGFIAPHQPRLDWQMWFAALGTWRQNPWFVSFVVRLQQNSPATLALLKSNPFPKSPPRYLRAMLYEYRFTNLEERKLTGAWWKVIPIGEYLPPISSDGRIGPPVARPVPAPAPRRKK